ncbi:hypothetical protein CHUAL_014016 [Chamberlinius hualienensis]
MNVTTLNLKEVKRKVTRRYCSAFNCRVKNIEFPELSFFRFPKDEERCKQWVINSHRTDLLDKDAEYLFRNVRLCSLHFTDEMFSNEEKNRLRNIAVPTIFNDETTEHTQTTDENERFECPEDVAVSPANTSNVEIGNNNVEIELNWKEKCKQRMRRKNLSERERRRRYYEKIKRLEVQVKYLKLELEKSKLTEAPNNQNIKITKDVALHSLQSELTESENFLMQSFIGKSIKDYSDKEKCFYILFYLHEPKGYEYLRQRHINIPSSNILNQWMEEAGLSSEETV